MKKIIVVFLAICLVVCLGCVGQISRVSADETQILETADIRLEISKTGYKYLNTDAGIYFELPYSPKRFDFCDRKLVEEGIQKNPLWLEKWGGIEILRIKDRNNVANISVYLGENFSPEETIPKLLRGYCGNRAFTKIEHTVSEQQITNGTKIIKEFFDLNINGRLRTIILAYSSSSGVENPEYKTLLFRVSNYSRHDKKIVEIVDKILSTLILRGDKLAG